MSGSPGTSRKARLLELLDLICLDSLEIPLRDQESWMGQISTWFVEARDLIDGMDDDE